LVEEILIQYRPKIKIKIKGRIKLSLKLNPMVSLSLQLKVVTIVLASLQLLLLITKLLSLMLNWNNQLVKSKRSQALKLSLTGTRDARTKEEAKKPIQSTIRGNTET